MLKYAVAGVLLLVGLAAAGPAVAQSAVAPPAVAPQPYDTESPARIRQEMDRPVDRPRARDAGVPAPKESASPERAGYPSIAPCADCPPPKHYDNVEVKKTTRDVDNSRVINTESVVEVPPTTRESNKLIVHDNETRNVGVIQHNHRIIEKEIRYVRRAPMQQYVPAYRPARRVQTVLVPVLIQPQPAPCGCPCTCSGNNQVYGYGNYAYPRYAYAPVRSPVQHVLVPVVASNGYDYGYGYR